MNHRSVAHAFAHGQQGKGCNMFTDGDTIYSYGRHFAIAAFVSRCPSVVLFNSNGYSVSTSKHQSYTSSALQGNGYTIFTVPNVSENPSHIDHAHNLIYLADECSDARAKSFRARKYGEIYQRQANGLFEDIQQYIETFEISDVPEDVSTFLNQHKDGLFSSKDEDLFEERARKYKEENAKREKIKRIEAVKQMAEDIEKFHNHETSSIPYNWRYNSNFAYIRLSHDRLNVQTSKGVTVPAALVKRLYRQSKTVDIAGQVITDINNVQYTINKFNGEFKAGCHTIQREEIEALATSEAW